MEGPRVDFIEELLQESETRREQQAVEMDKLTADKMLSAVAVLESQMQDVNQLVKKEIQLLESYRETELGRLDKKRSWLTFNLEGYMRSSGAKTMNLPHGQLKLRKSRDRVVIVAMEQFMEIGVKLGLLRKVPESLTPDTKAILTHVHSTGEILPGIEVIPAEVKFSYSTNGGNNGSERERAEEEG